MNATWDPRTPVIVGVAQLNRRPTEDEVETATEPVDMMADVVRSAAADSGAGDALLTRTSFSGLRSSGRPALSVTNGDLSRLLSRCRYITRCETMR